MFKRIKRIFIILVIVLLVLSSLPFLNKKKMDQPTLNNHKKRLQKQHNKDALVNLIESPQEALMIRLALIEKAQDTISLSYYRIQGDDKYTQHILAALMLAAQRGVKVNLVVDAKFGGLDKNIIKMLNSNENMSVYLYNPINIKKPESLQVSLHNKFMIVDDEYIITGGRNLSNTFLQEANQKNHVAFDLDVLIKANPNTHSIVNDFNSLFSKIINPSYTLKQNLKSKKSSFRKKEKFIKSYKNYKEKQAISFTNVMDNVNDSLFLVDNIQLIHTDLQPINKEPIIFHTLCEIAEKNAGEIYIQSPYVIADDLILNNLNKLSKQKTVHLLTNSLRSSPNYPAYSNYLIHRKKIMNTGANIHEYTSDGMTSVHTKAYILGEHMSAIGSMNLDNRSLFINSEQMILIDSETMHQRLLSVMSNQITQSNYVSSDLKQYKKNYEKNVSIFKKVLMKLCAIILRPFQIFL